MSLLRRRITRLAWIALALGVGTIVAGELAGWGWARLVSAALASVGGIALGANLGLGQPGRQRLRSWLRRRAMLLSSLLAAVMVLPPIAALAAVAAGVISAPGGGRAITLALGGTALAVAMLAATLVVTLIALRSIHDAARATPSSSPNPGAEREHA